jgi:hypothetical protein
MLAVFALNQNGQRVIMRCVPGVMFPAKLPDSDCKSEAPMKAPCSRLWLYGFVAFVGGCLALVAWGKFDWCDGWAQHYAATADRLRKDAMDLTFSQEQVTEYRVAAEWHDIIARKYAHVAYQPWLPSPGYPLITEEDKLEALNKYEERFAQSNQETN